MGLWQAEHPYALVANPDAGDPRPSRRQYNRGHGRRAQSQTLLPVKQTGGYPGRVSDKWGKAWLPPPEPQPRPRKARYLDSLGEDVAGFASILCTAMTPAQRVATLARGAPRGRW